MSDPSRSIPPSPMDPTEPEPRPEITPPDAPPPRPVEVPPIGVPPDPPPVRARLDDMKPPRNVAIISRSVSRANLSR